jgi:hypothetical protein
VESFLTFIAERARLKHEDVATDAIAFLLKTSPVARDAFREFLSLLGYDSLDGSVVKRARSRSVQQPDWRRSVSVLYRSGETASAGERETKRQLLTKRFMPA